MFTGLLPGDYIVRVDASNFTGSGALLGRSTSTGNNIPVGPDNDFLEGLPLVGKRSFFWSSGLFTTAT